MCGQQKEMLSAMLRHAFFSFESTITVSHKKCSVPKGGRKKQNEPEMLLESCPILGRSVIDLSPYSTSIHPVLHPWFWFTKKKSRTGQHYCIAKRSNHSAPSLALNVSRVFSIANVVRDA